MNSLNQTKEYRTQMQSGAHWSLKMRKGTVLRIKDLNGNANVGILFYNPENLLERYNAPDSLKCQHTFKITQGHCLYSDMGRIFSSVIEDQFGWHDSVCGSSHSEHVSKQWGKRDYQQDRNEWHQNGTDAFLVELAKYGLGKADLASNLNLFSEVVTDKAGVMTLSERSSKDKSVALRFEMDTLVLLHTCPHPLVISDDYPRFSVELEISEAAPVPQDDECLNSCEENKRGFQNNALYHLGIS